MKKNSSIIRILCLALVLVVTLTMSGVGVFAADGVEGITLPDTESEEIDDSESIEIPVAEGQNSIDVTATDTVKGGTVNLNWSAPETATSSTEYTVSYEDQTLAPVSATSAVISKLTDGKEYTFTVTCTIDDVVLSGSANATPTSPLKVSGLEYVKDYNGVTLKWDISENQDITGYMFYRNGAYLYKKEKSQLAADKRKPTKYNLYIGGSGFNDKDGKNVPKYGNKYEVVPVVSGDVKAYTPQRTAITGYCVRPYYVKITFKTSASLTCHCGHNCKKSFKAGQTVYATGFTSGKYVFYYTVNGKTHKFYANRTRTKNASSIYTSKWDYSIESAENFVNHKGLTSKTNYLIWTSFYTQRVYIFKASNYKYVDGKKRYYNWTCVKNHSVSTGKAASPSPNGSKEVWKHIGSRHSLKYWTCFSTYNAFHSVNAASWKKKLGNPASGGCIRNTKTNAYWIYTKCKNGTRVYNY